MPSMHMVGDIEDMQFMRGLAERAWAEPSAPKTMSSTTRSTTPTRRARPSKEVYAKQSTVLRRDRDELGDGMVPGMQTIFMKTQGCAHNVSDGEYMAGLLASYGYEITEEWSDQVDVFLFNSCTVKGPSQDSFLNMVAKAKSSGAPVVVAGCVPQGEPGRDDFEVRNTKKKRMRARARGRKQETELEPEKEPEAEREWERESVCV